MGHFWFFRYFLAPKRPNGKFVILFLSIGHFLTKNCVLEKSINHSSNGDEVKTPPSYFCTSILRGEIGRPFLLVKYTKNYFTYLGGCCIMGHLGQFTAHTISHNKNTAFRKHTIMHIRISFILRLPESERLGIFYQDGHNMWITKHHQSRAPNIRINHKTRNIMPIDTLLASIVPCNNSLDGQKGMRPISPHIARIDIKKKLKKIFWYFFL